MFIFLLLAIVEHGNSETNNIYKYNANKNAWSKTN